MEDRENVDILGRFFSKRELFWNGIAFLLIGVTYDIVAIGSRLHSDWKENIDHSMDNIDNGWVIQTLFFVISYMLLDKRFFGNNMQVAIDKHGYLKYFSLKLLLVFILVFVNLMLKSIGLILFF